MLNYAPPNRDMLFWLTELFEVCASLSGIPRFAHLSPDLVDALLTEAGNFCRNRLLPLNAIGDEEGCRLVSGSVRTPGGFPEAFRDLAEGGWIGLFADEADGGQALPETLNFLLHEMIMSTNLSFGDYVGLPQAAYRTLKAHGSAALKERYARGFVDGTLGATMCMTEPQCGTDLGLIRTRAVLREDARYEISGTKIFISAGDQDLTDNILHLVLARTNDAPPGTRGLSLFAVPKRLPDGSRNAVHATQLERKMGYKAAATCEMRFEGAIGWLVGELQRGLRAIFVMVNTARILVALQGLGTAEIAYQNAAHYARERLQGRALTGPAQPDLIADPLIVQPDVRRLLLRSRSFIEAARGLVIYVAWHLDMATHGSGPQAERAQRRVSLLTPVLKAVLTDEGFRACNDCLQIFGGHGYIWANGMEQLVRDCRIASIQEGANGIQALDLVARKIVADRGQALRELLEDLRAALDGHPPTGGVAASLSSPLRRALDQLEESSRWLIERGSADAIALGAASHEYLRIFGLVMLGWMWFRAAVVSSAHPTDDFYRTKMYLARYFFERELPTIDAGQILLRASVDSLMAMPAELF